MDLTLESYTTVSTLPDIIHLFLIMYVNYNCRTILQETILNIIRKKI